MSRKRGGDNFIIPDGDDPLGIEAMTLMQKVEANIAGEYVMPLGPPESTPVRCLTAL